MLPSSFPVKPVVLAVALALNLAAAQAQTASPAPTTPDSSHSLATITVNASADASVQGLSPAFAGGQVARGGRAGILGTRDNMDTPFSITSYTNELIQDRQARSVGDVLQNDPTVRVARGFGNFQESYFIRGFILTSDDVAYNGLYGLLPRQYIATELFERVEVLRGASAFLNGATPNGAAIGGSVNLVPKRAPNEPLSRITVGAGSGGQTSVSADVARRFGPDQSTGLRLNLGHREGGSGVDNEEARLDVASVALDWRSRDLRLSGDIGHQKHGLRQTRTNVTLSGVTAVPAVPDNRANFAQPWTFSDETDTFGTLRGEYDINDQLTAWAAYGGRRSDEANSLANLTVTNATTGAGNVSRFDNTREDRVSTGEVGLRGKLRTGSVGHEWVVSASSFELEKNNAYAWDFFNTLSTNLYTPTSYARPGFSGTALRGNNLASPALNGRIRLKSTAVGDTLSLLDNSLLVTLGLRHQQLQINNYAYNTGVEDSYNKSRTSPVAGVVYKAGKQVSVYANYVEGLSQGETAPGTASNRGEMLAPFVSKQQEIGVKYDGGRIGGGIALFSTTKPRTLTNAANVFTAEGEDRHRGMELTAFGEVTRGLRLLGGATWLDARQLATGAAATDGQRVIGVPRMQGSMGVEWDVPAACGLALDSRVVHTGSSYANATGTLKVPGWTRLDVGARYLTEIQGRLVTLRARIDNVTDRNYWASVGGYPGSGYLVVGAPRTFSLSASVDF